MSIFSVLIEFSIFYSNIFFLLQFLLQFFAPKFGIFKEIWSEVFLKDNAYDLVTGMRICSVLT